jgi:hypothetical protein
LVLVAQLKLLTVKTVRMVVLLHLARLLLHLVAVMVGQQMLVTLAVQVVVALAHLLNHPQVVAHQVAILLLAVQVIMGQVIFMLVVVAALHRQVWQVRRLSAVTAVKDIC